MRRSSVRFLGTLVVVIGVLLAGAESASAQVTSTSDARGDATAVFDLTNVTYDHRSRVTVITYKVRTFSARPLFGTRLQPYATDVAYDIYALPPGASGYRPGRAGFVDRYGEAGFEAEACTHLRSARSDARHTVRIWVPRSCVGGRYTNRVHVASYSWDFDAAAHNVRDRTRGIWIRRT